MNVCDGSVAYAVVVVVVVGAAILGSVDAACIIGGGGTACSFADTLKEFIYTEITARERERALG